MFSSSMFDRRNPLLLITLTNVYATQHIVRVTQNSKVDSVTIPATLQRDVFSPYFLNTPSIQQRNEVSSWAYSTGSRKRLAVTIPRSWLIEMTVHRHLMLLKCNIALKDAREFTIAALE